MNVYDKERSKKYSKKVDENPEIVKKGKKINLRQYINEGFESSDLMTNIRKFGSTEKITKESAFLILDDILLNADFRDLLDIQKQGKIAYNTISAEYKRQLDEKKFLKEYEKYKDLKDKEHENSNKNINKNKGEIKNENTNKDISA